ncbi:MAG TPA: TldD/PmbA family protein [Candidatus Marinimicrobia bacterium]|nr:TldD/PmbA family protein [Candidatus Neomarinimicrobiota bacterium]
MKIDEYSKLLEWLESRAKTLGADAIKAVIGSNRQFNMSQRDGKIETLKESVQASLYIELFVNGKYSSHSTNDLRKSVLEGFLANTVEMTRYLNKDEFRSLPDPKLYAGRENLELELADKSIDKITMEQKRAWIDEVEKTAKSLDKRIISVSADYWDVNGLSVRRHSNGFFGVTEGTNIGLGASVSLLDENGKKPEGWRYIGMRHQSDLWKPADIAADAVKRAQQKVGAKKIPSGRMTMLLQNDSTGRLLYPIVSALSGRNLQQDSSFLKGKLGEKIAPEILTIIDDPLIVRGPSSRLFDGEGIAAKKRLVIENGVLKTYFIDTYYAKKLGVEPTTGGTSNTIFQPGVKDQATMIKDIEKGILVTSFIGGNSNGATGDYSYGVMGLYIENGEIIHPVAEMNVSGNYLELLMKLTEMGSDLNMYSGLRTPSMRFDDIDFAGL